MNDLPPNVRRQVFWKFSLIEQFAAAFAWVLFLIVAIFGWEPLRFLSVEKEPLGATIYFWVALATTLVCGASAGWRINKALVLLTQGVEIDGEVISAAPIFIYGFRMIRFDVTYSCDDCQHTHAWSESRELKRNIQVGDAVPLLVDPNHPKRCLRKEEYLN